MQTITWDNIRALRKRIEREIAATERNVESLRVLFGGQVCQGSVDTYGRLALQEMA